MKTVIITGATGGLGSCLVKLLVPKADYNIICTYRNEEKFNHILGVINSPLSGYKINHEDTYNTLLNMINKDTDELILILNGFSIKPIKTVGDYDTSDIEDMIEYNIKHQVYLLNSLVHYCKNNDLEMRIINIDSGAADFPLKGWGNYCASKSYTNALLRVVSLENPHFKIVSIDPGVMDTDMQKQIRNTPKEIFERVDEFRKYKENGILRNPIDVAGFIVNRYVLNWDAIEFREKVD